MFEQQRFVDLQENSSFTNPGFPIITTSRTAATRPELSPHSLTLIQFGSRPLQRSRRDDPSRAESKHSFTRRGSMIYTKTPSRESLSRKHSQLELLISLREQLEDLQRKLFEKDELLKSAEISKNEINKTHTELDRLKRHAVEKDSLTKSIQMQLSDAKINLQTSRLPWKRRSGKQ
ncbi:protein MICROTUBULE BINDING PROTEIN 2C-like [Hibiscus syriacus]|uniref:protein MICROTUBULE BINDING PROTEIN 2C-like n=1 Tax=Hibiscus syriacus TaxID=106335 RepID=UPI0019249E92|nr:protein MICROTUBULE BINDING PROTEIN 2C-like [Hibiscus syriacus]